VELHGNPEEHILALFRIAVVGIDLGMSIVFLEWCIGDGIARWAPWNMSVRNSPHHLYGHTAAVLLLSAPECRMATIVLRRLCNHTSFNTSAVKQAFLIINPGQIYDLGLQLYVFYSIIV
jgi:hypothetical protein